MEVRSEVGASALLMRAGVHGANGANGHEGGLGMVLAAASDAVRKQGAVQLAGIEVHSGQGCDGGACTHTQGGTRRI